MIIFWTPSPSKTTHSLLVGSNFIFGAFGFMKWKYFFIRIILFSAQGCNSEIVCGKWNKFRNMHFTHLSSPCSHSSIGQLESLKKLHKKRKKICSFSVTQKERKNILFQMKSSTEMQRLEGLTDASSRL